MGVTWGNVEVTGKVIALVVWGKSKESHLRGLKCSDLFGILRALADEALCNRAFDRNPTWVTPKARVRDEHLGCPITVLLEIADEIRLV